MGAGLTEKAPAPECEARKHWLSVGEDVADLIAPESADRFDVRPISEAEVAAAMA